MTFTQIAFPGGVLALAAGGGWLADRAARFRRRPHGERGDFWTTVVLRLCVGLALPVFILSWAAVVPQLWQSGWHLQFDLSGGLGWPPALRYAVALLLPFAMWTLLLLLGLAAKPRLRGTGGEGGRWLAGAISGNHRYWILLCALPLAAILFATVSDLGIGPAGYPAATWGTLAVLMLSLIGVALSEGQPVFVVQQTTASAVSVSVLRAWPEALREHGLQLRTITSWEATPAPRPVRRGTTFDLVERLRLRGAASVAPELIEAVDGLFGARADEVNRVRLVFGADDCGQEEAVALAAELLDQRSHAATLVVTAGDADATAARIARWLPSGRVAALHPTEHTEAEALVVVVDAQTLSDHLLPAFKNPTVLKRFGLVVWWQVHEYTGVLAANLWAISRRLHRLFEAMGRPDVRTLIFVRHARHGDAQLGAFVRRVLPLHLPAEVEHHVESRYRRAVHLHVLEGHQQFFARGEGENIQQRYRHVPLVAAKVSVTEGWRTHLALPQDVTASEAAAFLQLPVGDRPLHESLQPDCASASARVRKIDTGEVLSLVEIIREGGRSADAILPHHAGITLPENPYARYLISRLEKGEPFSTSRRLIAVAAQPSVIRRHLLLALNELPDTTTGLLKDFLWNKDVVNATLKELADEEKLTRKEVRFINEFNRLQREHEHNVRRVPGGERRPLDALGTALIEVRDPAGGDEPDDGVRMRVDPDRVTIQAYPHRVFLHAGRRYRIREWTTVNAHRWLECTQEAAYCMTWRVRNAFVFGIKTTEAPVGLGRTAQFLSRLTASLTYQEEVIGAMRITPDLTTGAIPLPETPRLARPVSCSFDTRALLLRFPEEEDELALASLAQALRHVLPVHVGVEEDAIEVVPLLGEPVQGRPMFGVAIVDLYPGGIGAIDAIADDNTFLLRLLTWAKDWLEACGCRSDQGCERCLRSPAALAANSDQPPMRKAALRLLRQVV